MVYLWLLLPIGTIGLIVCLDAFSTHNKKVKGEKASKGFMGLLRRFV